MIWCYSKTFARHFAFSTYSFLVIGNKESQRQLATMSFGRDNVSASVFITKRKKNNKRRLKTSKTACEWNLCWNTFACRNVFMSSPSPSSILFLGCFHPTENMSLSMMSRRINEKHKEKSETEKKKLWENPPRKLLRHIFPHQLPPHSVVVVHDSILYSCECFSLFSLAAEAAACDGKMSNMKKINFII